ncbi:MAG: hypothetical protein KUG75_13295 [Pseudomonadales bacterium]|nr:hypothetical protein [Pseudomonadales bacterium]
MLLENLLCRYETLNMRERVLVGITVCAVTWFGWQVLVFDGMNTEISGLQAQIDNITENISTEISEQKSLEKARHQLDFGRLQGERVALLANNEKLRVRLDSAMGQFIEPGRMPSVLKKLLGSHDRLKLIHLVSLPAISVGEGEGEKGGLDSDKNRSLYRHAVRLELEGEYFDFLGYINDLEASGWHFIWRELQYSVIDHPIARATLTLETLSDDRNWVGV